MLRTLLLMMSIAITSVPAAEFRFTLEDPKRERSLPLLLRVPDSLEQPAPVILLSHGLGGSREGLSWAAQAWVTEGYVTITIQHPGSDRAVWENLPRRERFNALKQAASGQQLRNRIGDVTAVLNALPIWQDDANHPAHQRLHLQRVAIAGHSFGAATVLAMMGRKYPQGLQVREPRLIAGLALSPAPGPAMLQKRAFGHMQRPMLLVTGTEDSSVITPHIGPEERQQVFTHLPPGAAWQAVFHGGKHGDFEDGKLNASTQQKRIQQALISISRDFWLAHLQDDHNATQRLNQSRDDLNENDVWQFK